MKKIVPYLVLLLGVSLLWTPLRAAKGIDAPRVVVDGREYWVHTVVKEETLYAISRTYNVPLATIVSQNPDLYNGLKAGQKIRIPVPDGQRHKPVGQRDYRLHIVGPGESLFQLARIYGVSVHAIREANSIKGDVLSVSEPIRIPMGAAARRYDSIHQSKRQPDGAYIVTAGESIYGIARKFEISQDELIEANPQLRTHALATGQRLTIPKGAKVKDAKTFHLERPEWMDRTSYKRLENAKMCAKMPAWPKDKPLIVSLLLPFRLQPETKSMSSPPQTVKSDERFLEFYQGFLLGMEEISKQGYAVHLRVFDTERSIQRVKQILDADSLAGSSLIVGPVYPRNVTEVSLYGAQNRISMVSPLSSKTPTLEANPFIFHANPSEKTQLREMVARLRKKAKGQIILFHEESIKDAELVSNVQLMLRSEMAGATLPADRLKVFTIPRGQVAEKYISTLSNTLWADSLSTIVIPSTREPFISDILGALNEKAIAGKHHMQVYGMSKWLKMNLDFNHLTRLKVTLFYPFHVDYKNERTVSFVQEFRTTYTAEPSQFAFQGYDVATYFLAALTKYGEDFRFCLSGIPPRLTQNHFDFEQHQGYGSYENQGIFLLQFNTHEGLSPISIKGH
ncbi:MAG: hypothetical protein CSA07_05160 [Bacteroidia bacterium]|nr:MAG: hypothetical protein CSA07_05160 [Bacteroidia bacterium]